MFRLLNLVPIGGRSDSSCSRLRRRTGLFERLEDRRMLSQGGIEGLGVLGDSLSDEYAGELHGYARGWVELLAQEKNVPLGRWHDWAEPRREGYEYNWARYGDSSTSLLLHGQHTGLAEQVRDGHVSHALLAIGQNDFYFLGSAYENIYKGQSSAEAIHRYSEAVLANIHTAVRTLVESGVDLVVSNIIDFGVAPTVRYCRDDPDKRERVADAISDLNERIAVLARDYRVPVADFFGFTKALLGTNHQPVASHVIAGEVFHNRGGIGGHNEFVLDGVHPHTVPQAIFANLFLEALSQGYGTTVPQFTESEMAALIGSQYSGSGTYPIDYGDFVLLPAAADPAALAGRIWPDLDGDGLQNEAVALAAPEIRVELYSAGSDGVVGGVDDVLVDSSVGTTFEFTGLPLGDYYVQFTDLPLGWGFTMADAGGDTVDSDADQYTGRTDVFTLGPGETASQCDAGVVQYAQLISDASRPGETALSLQGTMMDDRIVVEEGAPSGDVAVTIAHAGGGQILQGVFSPTLGGRILIDAKEGNDEVLLDRYVSRDAVLTGGPGHDVLLAGSGHDQLNGGDGDDRLLGMAGDDTMLGGPGDDDLRGSFGNDSLDGGDGNDAVFGHAGHDVLQGGTGDDGLYGGSGNDAVTGGHGINRLYGHSGDDTLLGGPSRDYLRASAGNDLLDGGDGVDRLFGQGDDDRLLGGTGNDYLSGGHGNDYLDGGANNDRMYGGRGDDRLEAGHGVDALYGGLGDDWLWGGSRDDSLFGGGGNDVLLGGQDDDHLHGNGDRDLLIGGPGSDHLSGSSGEDLLVGGSTDHDEDDLALAAVFAEWTADSPVDERIEHLENGGGLNDPFLLSKAATVPDDGERDQLRGGQEEDWLLYFATDELLD